ncbi:acyl carrier protein [Caenimonas terrae]|uniref:Acyl carrier protein n=1 Tax=Caenimonas terrae TaxID=696074 RepID=A0ABW0NGF6_9BURK
MSVASQTPAWSADALEDWLLERIARLTSVAPAAVDPEAPFVSLNLDSVAVMDIVVALEDLLGFEIESTIAWDYPTVRLLSGHIAGLAARQAAATPGQPPC